MSFTINLQYVVKIFTMGEIRRESNHEAYMDGITIVLVFFFQTGETDYPKKK